METYPRRVLFILAAWFSLAALSLWAATQNALVTGSVFDNTGAPVAGATVRLINASTGFSHVQTTDSDGNYTYPTVPPAEGYVLSVEVSGFATEIRQDLEVTVGENKLVLPPFVLQPLAQAAAEAAPPQPTPAAPAGPQPAKPAKPTPQPSQPTRAVSPPTPAARVTRASKAPTVSLELVSTTLGGVIDSRTVRTLPLAGRDFLDLALLVPGTYPVEQGSALEGASLVVNGVRANMNNFLLDGVDNNDYTINQSLPFQIVEAVQEFRVQTSTSAAEYGRSGGAQINAISRSGSNAFHGTLFEFFRGDQLGARNSLSAYRGGSFDAFAQSTRVDKIVTGPDPFDPIACFFQGGSCEGTLFPTSALEDPGLRSAFDDGRKPPFKQHQFGANVGGRLVKNKAFFFFNWESFRANNARPVFERVPAQVCRDFDSCNATVAPFFGFSFTPDNNTALASAILNTFPGPNVPESAVVNALGLPVSDPQNAELGVATFIDPGTGASVDLLCFDCAGAFFATQTKNLTHSDNFLERVDVRPNDRVSLSFKHNIQRIEQIQGGTLPATSGYPGNGTSLNGRNQNFSINYVHQKSERTVNELRLGWNRFRLNNLPVDRTLDPSGIFHNLNFAEKGFPSVLVGGFTYTRGPYANLGSNFTAPGKRANNLWSVADNISRTWGRHNLKAGAEGRYNRLDVNNEAMGRGLLTFFTPWFGALTGLPDLASIARTAPEFGGVDGRGGFDRSFRAGSFAWFVQDTWRARPSLNLTLGIRHEINQAPVEAGNRLVNNYAGACPDLVCLVRSGTSDVLRSDGTPLGRVFNAPRGGFKTDYNNFSPHVGLAWAPGSSRRTVFRAAYAVTYDQQPLQASANMLLNPPFVQQWTSFYPFAFLGDTFPPGFPSTSFDIFDLDGDTNYSAWFRQPFSIVARDVNTRSSYVHQFNFGIQRQWGNSSAFEVAYVGSIGHKLPRQRLLLECTQDIFTSTNLLDPVSCLPQGYLDFLFFPFTPQDLGINPAADSVINQENSANSNFHSLLARWEIRGFHGMTVRLHYQWAHSIDNASAVSTPAFLFSPPTAALLQFFSGINSDQFAALNNTNPTLSLRPGLPTITTRALLPTDTMNSPNFAGERANSDFDVRQRFVIHYIYDVPAWKRLRAVARGWQLAGIATIQKGQPFTVFGDFFGLPLRPDLKKSPVINNDNPDGAIDGALPVGCNIDPVNSPCTGTSATSAFDPTPNATFKPGSLPRNVFRGPRLANFDFSVLKNTYLRSGERMNLQFRAEFFNLFNNVNFLQPFSQTGQFIAPFTALDPDFKGVTIQNPFFGRILQARPARQIQFGLKLIF